MKHALYLFVFLLVVAGCKHNTNDIPTPTNPLTFSVLSDSISINPYGYTPLSALVNFTGPVEGKTFIRVRGKHGSITNVENVFNDKGTAHSIPVIGLYANYLNTVDVRLLNDSGDTLAASTLTIQTGDLPPNMPTAITASAFDESKVTPGLVLVSNYSDRDTGSPSTPFLMDAYGDIRWVLDYRNHSQLKTLSYDDGIERLRNGNFFFGDINSSAVYEVDLLGKVVTSWSLQGYLFHHNVIEKPDGNFILTATKPGSMGLSGIETIEDYVIEVDRKSGQVLNEWDLKQSLDEQRTALSASPFVTANDWFHGNSVVYDSTDNTIIVSGRHQGVVKLDYQNQIKWILAAHRGWGTNRRDEDLNQYLLQPLDANGVAITDPEVLDGSKISADFEWNWYQHSNIQLPNGDVMVFDNGDIREYDSGASRYSRAVSYKIDPVKMTVQQTWAYGKERGLETYSQIISSVQYLGQSNHVVFAPGYQVENTTGKGGKVVEIDMKTKEVVSEISISAANLWGFHRAKKMSAYPGTL
ncbi:aryl-sulfate sulfotransferase [Spirosoma sp. SC4-14]|uniref:aryl-sulfate sulfotransferase n=1 Tax=Spirosoma sp. SC4-14 TaxID=3128900 RepID=UPI0030D20B78